MVTASECFRYSSMQKAIFSAFLLISLLAAAVLTEISSNFSYQKNGPFLTEEDRERIDSGDTAWMMASSAVTLIMTPGIAFFYCGMVRRSSLISMLIQSFSIMGIIIILWTVVGFSLAFGDNWDSDGLIGNPSTFGFLRNVGAAPNPILCPTFPMTVFAFFEMAFAVITPALIIGSVAERAKFNSLMIFVVFWHLLVYCPIAHMEWHPDGFIKSFGHKDFAGGIVVHITSGYSALMLAYLTGARREVKLEDHSPAHIPFVILGTALLWFGWFGFNGGSAFGANYNAGQAIMNTNISGGTSMISWMLWDYMHGRKINAIGLCGGLIVGLIAVTPGCGYISFGGAMVIGVISPIVSNIALNKFQFLIDIDDTLDVWAFHGLGGTTGMILTSCFATDHVYEDDLLGLFYGGTTFFWHTIVVTTLVAAYCCIMTFLIFVFVNYFIEFRVSESVEIDGIDSSIHGDGIGIFEMSDQRKIEISAVLNSTNSSNNNVLYPNIAETARNTLE